MYKRQLLINEEEASAPDIDTFINESVPDGEDYDEYVGNMVMMEIGDQRLRCVVKTQVA